MSMNAHDTGHEAGFARIMAYVRIQKATFQRIGEHTAKGLYKTEQKRQEFLAGWMENWTEPHPAECTCDACELLRSEIQTF